MRQRGRRDDPLTEFDGLVEIGAGTFARVYRAHDTRTGQLVALKILRARSSRTFDLDLFEHEARTLGPLSGHPHIVTLFRAFVSAKGEPVLVMELCSSSMASAIAKSGPLDARRAVATAIKLAGALETAHRADIVHRDIKPQNILITSYGEPALADFGVAALRSGGSPGSPSSAMTLFHAAPEVILGAEGDRRSDVYSLASTLFELLEGHPPFFVTSLEDPRDVQTRVVTRPAPRLSGNDIPVRLADMMRRSLSKEPSDRPESALEVAQLLRLVEEGEGWRTTPCPIAGLDDLPRLEVTGSPPTDPTRAARSTSIPPLGPTVRGFGDVVRAAPLEPMPVEAAEVAGTRPVDPDPRRALEPIARSVTETPEGPVAGGPVADGPAQVIEERPPEVLAESPVADVAPPPAPEPASMPEPASTPAEEAGPEHIAPEPARRPESDMVARLRALSGVAPGPAMAAEERTGTATPADRADSGAFPMPATSVTEPSHLVTERTDGSGGEDGSDVEADDTSGEDSAPQWRFGSAPVDRSVPLDGTVARQQADRRDDPKAAEPKRGGLRRLLGR